MEFQMLTGTNEISNINWHKRNFKLMLAGINGFQILTGINGISNVKL